MSSTHRKKLARALAEATGLTYQQALARVIDAFDAGLLPHTLDADGITRVVATLAGGIEVVAPARSEHTPRVDHVLVTPPYGHMLISGPTGAGKSVIAHDIIGVHRGLGHRVDVLDVTEQIVPLVDRNASTPEDMNRIVNSCLVSTEPRLVVVENGLLGETAPYTQRLLAAAKKRPGLLRVVVTSDRGLDSGAVAATGGELTLESFDTRVLLGPASFGLGARALLTPHENAPGGRGWATVESRFGTQRINLRGENEELSTELTHSHKTQLPTHLRRIAAMQRAGITAADAFETAAKSVRPGALNDRLNQVAALVRTDVSVSTAMRAALDLDAWAVAIVDAGARSGQLDGAFDEIASLLP